MMTRAAMICAAVSVIAHMGGVAVMTGGEAIEIAGAAPAQARLGNSFQDIAAGSVAAAPEPHGGGAVSVVQDAVVAPNLPAEVTPPIVAATATPSPAVEVSAEAAAVSRTPTEPDTSLPQTPSATIIPVTPTETIAGEEPVRVSAATDNTVRPRPRPEPKGEAPAPPPKRRTAEDGDVSPPAASLGAAEAERRGVAEGVETGASNDVGSVTGATTEAGNALASNYPGAVMRKINRTRKPRVGVQGTAIVGFEIAANGTLAGVQILQSSGESTIDQAALDHLRRAAPFPAPPAGAQRKFQVEYVSRG
jgi:periplasmic protein TonB